MRLSSDVKLLMANKKTARYCFTINNPGDYRPTFDEDHMAYMIFSLEKGESGTPHLQGYVRFKSRRAFTSAKNYIGGGCHIEAAKGDEAANRAYCIKDATPPYNEYGTFDPTQGVSKQGSRNDLTTALDKLKNGIPKDQVFREHSSLLVKYPAGMEKAAEALLPKLPPSRPVKNYVLWGETGTGKSHRARMTFPDAYVGNVGVGTFDRYSAEETVILDEFEPQLVPITDLLQWLDTWTSQLKCRYSNKTTRWSRMIICSNIPPDQWYLLAEERQKAALLRRLTPPMGHIYNVLTRDQEFDLQIPPEPVSAPPPTLLSPSAAGSSTALPAPVPMSRPPTPTTPPRALKRTNHPSHSTSPPMEPPLQRRTTSSVPLPTCGGTTTPASPLLGDDPSVPIDLDF